MVGCPYEHEASWIAARVVEAETGVRPKLGEYDEGIIVTLEGVCRLLADIVDQARTSPEHETFVQLAPIGACDDACAHGIDLFCRVEPKFSLTMRLAWVLKRAAEIQRIATGYPIERREDTSALSRWLVTFRSFDDPIATILHRVLQEICGCREGEQTFAYWPDPGQWSEEDVLDNRTGQT